MNYNGIFVLLLCFSIIIILLSGIIYHLKNIYKMDRKKRKSKLIDIFICSIILGIIFTICFIGIFGQISTSITLIYFGIGFFVGALIGLEEPRPLLNEIHD